MSSDFILSETRNRSAEYFLKEEPVLVETRCCANHIGLVFLRRWRSMTAVRITPEEACPVALTLMLMMNSKRLSLARWKYNIDSPGAYPAFSWASTWRAGGRGEYVRKQVAVFARSHSLQRMSRPWISIFKKWTSSLEAGWHCSKGHNDTFLTVPA